MPGWPPPEFVYSPPSIPILHPSPKWTSVWVNSPWVAYEVPKFPIACKLLVTTLFTPNLYLQWNLSFWTNLNLYISLACYKNWMLEFREEKLIIYIPLNCTWLQFFLKDEKRKRLKHLNPWNSLSMVCKWTLQRCHF
jgi:hypothetical protein